MQHLPKSFKCCAHFVEDSSALMNKYFERDASEYYIQSASFTIPFEHVYCLKTKLRMGIFKCFPLMLSYKEGWTCISILYFIW